MSKGPPPPLRLGGRFNMLTEDQVMSKLNAFVKDEKGASAAEYALILAVVCTAIAAALIFLKGAIANATNNAANLINNAS